MYSCKSLLAAKPLPVTKATGEEPAIKGAYAALFLTIAVVIMRSWAQIGLMTYIPFYDIDFLKGEPIYAGTLVSVLLLGGVVGTLGGSMLAGRWGHKPYLIGSMLLTSLLLPLIFVTQRFSLFVVVGVVGMVLISSFTVTTVIAQPILPRNLGIASRLMVGFAIGTGLPLSLPIRYSEPNG